MRDAMSDTFFFAVGIIFTGIGLLLITAKILTYIRCTVPINATVVKLEKEYTYFRGINHTHYRPIVGYVVDGKKYTEKPQGLNPCGFLLSCFKPFNITIIN